MVNDIEVRFEILGEPMGKQRPRFTTINGFAKAYTPKETTNYESKVVFAYKEARGITDWHDLDNRWFGNKELKVEITAYFQLQKTHYLKNGMVNKEGFRKLKGEINPTIKYDIDNICKCVLDGLNGIAYQDDKQVVELHAYKKYAEQPKVEVYITDEV